MVIMNSPPGPPATTPNSTAACGGALRSRAQGARSEALGAALAELDPDLRRWADGFIFGDVWSGEEIGFEDRMLVAIVSLATSGQTRQLRNYIHGALQSGIPAQRLQGALKMLVVYAGFPTAIDALVVLQEARAKYPDVAR
jgi:4-carboxymuconolactone decarboxylase